MKKFISLFLAIIVIAASCPAMAESIDFAAMTNEQLHALVDSARNELARRELIAGEKVVLLDHDGVQVYLTGEHDMIGSFAQLETVVINDSDVPVSFQFDSCCINGWEVNSSGISETNPGKKQKGNIMLLLEDAEISTYEEIEEIEFTFYLYNPEAYSRISENETMIVHFNAE